MDKNEIKLNVAKSYESGDRELFSKNILEYVTLIEDVKELNGFVEFISNKRVHSSIEDAEKKGLLREIIKDKIFELIIANGDTPHRNYLLLYSLYKEGGGLKDSRLDRYINFIDENIKGHKFNDIERVYFAYLRFLLSFIRGDKDSFKQFMKSILTLNIHQLESTSEVSFIREFIEKMEIGLEEFFETFREIFAPEYYFSRSPGERRSVFNWSLHCLWNVPKLFNDKRWMELYPLWKAVFYEHLERGEIDEALYVHFYIYHKMGNSFQTQAEWRKFNEEISRYASRYYIEWAKSHNIIKAKKEERKEGKKLIGFLRDRMVENSPFKVEYSVLKPLMEDENFTSKYEIKIYNMNYIEKSQTDQKAVELMRSIGIPTFDAHIPFYDEGFYFSHLQKALYLRQKIVEDGVDIMIAPVSGYDISDFLIATRTAPKQIFWCHGNFEYDIEGIDKRITHIGPTPLNQSGYPIECFDFKTHERYLGQKEEKFKTEAEKVRAKFPKGTVILGSIGRLVKVDSKEYLEAVAKIMRECPNTIYLACGMGNIDSIKKQVEELGISDRFYFEGWVDPDIYGYVIDVYLNTFPEVGGQSVQEYFNKRKRFTVVSYLKGAKEDYIKWAIECINAYPCLEKIEKSSKKSNIGLICDDSFFEKDGGFGKFLYRIVDEIKESVLIVYDADKKTRDRIETLLKPFCDDKRVIFKNFNVCETYSECDIFVTDSNMIVKDPKRYAPLIYRINFLSSSMYLDSVLSSDKMVISCYKELERVDSKLKNSLMAHGFNKDEADEVKNLFDGIEKLINKKSGRDTITYNNLDGFDAWFRTILYSINLEGFIQLFNSVVQGKWKILEKSLSDLLD